MQSGRRPSHRRRPWGLAVSLAAMCIGSLLILACGSDATPSFGSSRATVSGRISAGGAGLVGVSVSPDIYYEPGCTGPALPVTLRPTTVTSGADGRFRVEIEAFGLSSFGGCVRLTLRRPEAGATLSVTKAPLNFVDVRLGPAITTQFDVVWP
jgi:hypothetical protein